jgi:hypothetical protein
MGPRFQGTKGQPAPDLGREGQKADGKSNWQVYLKFSSLLCPSNL